MTRTIQKVLIANRGEIARRIRRTCRAMGIATVAVYSESETGVAHAQEADEAIQLPGARAAETYLNVAALIEAARRTGADAVHPGYGFLSENAQFAAACEAAGIAFVGPTSTVIARMGSKREARRLMAAAGAPVVPGYDGEDQSDKTLLAEAHRIGYPVMIKASAGGGGTGMRIIAEASEAAHAFAAARRESMAAFGDATLLLERAIVEPRHIEFQIFGDQHGALIHLGERECSIQRRHQKIIEESPAPGLTPALRARMAASALTVGRTLDYTNAGTVEFIMDSSGEYYFLEVNTRLQVEHPVTELVTGLDLVRWQIMIAEGRPLPLTQEQVVSSGHGIEARLYAEDPDADFLPSTGRIVLWREPVGERCDAGVRSGDPMLPEFDPLIAKISAHGATRADAARQLANAIEGAVALGVRTNAAFLSRVLRHPAFLQGATTTGFIERYHDTLFAVKPAPIPGLSPGMMAATLAALARHPARETAERQYWRNNPVRPIVERFSPARPARSGALAIESDAIITVSLTPLGAGRYTATCSSPQSVWTGEARGQVVEDGDGLAFELDGQAVRSYIATGDGGVTWVHVAGQTSALTWLDPLPEPAPHTSARGSLVAPMPGVVVALLVEVGQSVVAGQPLVTLEAMKMEHTVRAPRAGVVIATRCVAGNRIPAGAPLLDISPESDDE
jgi:acetyl/propionyl-CoA carboxylase alpha subunit